MFKDKLKKLRKDACETQAQLANALGVTQQAIDRWENARTEPNVTMLIQIARHFEVSVDYLLDNFDTEGWNVNGRDDIISSIVKMYEKLEPNEKRVLNKYIESVICSMGYVKNDETHVPVEESPQIVQTQTQEPELKVARTTNLTKTQPRRLTQEQWDTLENGEDVDLN